MISDADRREMAATMRAISVSGLRNLTLGEMLNSILTRGAPRPTTEMAILASLADLIDRPTCHDVGGSYAFRCSECGCVLDRYKAGNGYADDGVMSQGGDYVYAPRYCPWCGAEVVDK